MVLAAMVTTLGTLTGAAIAIVPPLFALLLVVVALIWIRRCRPGPSRLSRTFMVGVGLAGTILAVLALAGGSAPQQVPVLCGSMILMAATFLIGSDRRIRTPSCVFDPVSEDGCDVTPTLHPPGPLRR